MPQVQVLPGVPSFGTQLAQTLTQAGTDLAQGYMQGQQNKKAQIALQQFQDPNLSPLQRIKLFMSLPEDYKKHVSPVLASYIGPQAQAEADAAAYQKATGQSPYAAQQGAQPPQQWMPPQGMQPQGAPPQNMQQPAGMPSPQAEAPPIGMPMPAPQSQPNEVVPGYTEEKLEALREMAKHANSKNQFLAPEAKKAEMQLEHFEQLRKEAVKQAETEKASNIQEKQFAHKETERFAEVIKQDYNSAQEVKNAIGQARNALKNKATGASPRNLVYKHLTSKGSPYAGLFQTKDTQAIVSAQKALSGGFRNLFGGKPTEREFFWYENILPDLLKSGEVNESIFNYFEKAANLQLDAQNIYDKIVKDNGGFRPIDIDVKVREQLKPKIDKIISEGETLSSYVIMKAPDGSLRQVPKNEQDKYLKAGGILVE